MNIVLSPETQRLLEGRMKKCGFVTPDDALRTALETVEQVEGVALEDLDAETVQAIDEAEAQFARGEGRQWEDVRAELVAKYIKN